MPDVYRRQDMARCTKSSKEGEIGESEEGEARDIERIKAQSETFVFFESLKASYKMTAILPRLDAGLRGVL